MISPPGSPAPPNSYSLNPTALQNHIYTSFLERKTADVALRIRGTWNAIYNLHRVVLIQAGFFQSLFTSGFAESKAKLNGHRLGPDLIDVILEDPNITRAAFEVCIARLYGGGPTLFISPSLVPTPKHPLTPAFAPSNSTTTPATCPADHHPASPRFLLSLLATSVFLSIPSVASQTLSSILGTVGPNTAVRYLNFAIGNGIGEVDSEEPEAAVGLQGVAELLKDEEEESIMTMTTDSPVATPRPLSTAELAEKLKDLSTNLESPSSREGNRTSQLDIKKEDPSDIDSDLSFSTNALPEASQSSLYYGAVSDKIGEAAACWLARWGNDMLNYEQKELADDELSVIPSTPTPLARKRATTIPSHRLLGSNSLPEFTKTKGEPKISVPAIWRRGGLTARWVRGLLSSDALFVNGEKTRYDMARTIVELRRAEGILEEEETEWDTLFKQGIYYPNMSLDDLMSLSNDMSPTTGNPYAPLEVLQSGHWDQSMLRHRIMSRSSGSTYSPPSSPSSNSSTDRPKELGITSTTSEITVSLLGSSTSPQLRDASRYPVPTDSSLRIGDSSGLEGASMDQLFEVSSPSPSKKSTSTPNLLSAPASEANFFGLHQHALPTSSVTDNDPSGKARWSPYPPFRFGVEFWDVDSLKEKSRLHSRTIWYAGSLWNVYVQVVRKKGVQLGVYLHRQSSVDPIPPSSAPVTLPSSVSTPSPSPISRLQRSDSNGAPLQQTLSVPNAQYSPATPSRNGAYSTPSSPALPSSLPSSYSTTSVPLGNTSVTVPATAPSVMPQQPYRDPRSAVSAYFTITCASATGASLTRFTSAPDVFSVSQSWGWKSSSLRAEEYLEIGEDGIPQTTVAAGREISLRATIVLGIV